MAGASEIIEQDDAPVDVTVVVPIFNEAENLRPLDAEIVAALAGLDRRCEVIWVDDASTDGSGAVLDGLCVDEELVGEDAVETGVEKRVVHLRRNYGQSAALAAGFDHARGEVVIALDGDGQNNPADIPRLLAKLDQGFDVVSGWRRERKDRAVTRRLPSWVANRLISKISGVRLHDYGCTLKAYRRSFLQEILLYGEMHRYLPVFLARVGARIGEIEVDHRPRVHGVSKYGTERIFKVLPDLVLLGFMTRYFTRPMHFFGQVALLLFGFSLLCGAFMVVFKYGLTRFAGVDYQASFIETPLPILAATFLIGTILSLFFGILGEVLIRIYHDLRGHKPYAVAGIRSSFKPQGDRRIDGGGAAGG